MMIKFLNILASSFAKLSFHICLGVFNIIYVGKTRNPGLAVMVSHTRGSQFVTTDRTLAALIFFIIFVLCLGGYLDYSALN